MSPLIAAAIGLAGAIIFAAGSLWFELAGAPASTLVAAILVRLPQLGPPVIGVYAVLVLLTTTVALTAGIRRVRSRLKNAAPLDRDLWNSAFAGSGLSRLAPRLIHITSAKSTATADRILVDSPFEPRNASHEIARLYQNWLSRGQFFTALVILIALGAVGLAEEHGLIVPGGMPITATPIFAAVLALMVLAVYFRLAVDAAAEPLVDALACLPFERIEISLLQSAVVALQQRRSDPALDSSSSSAHPAAESLARSLLRGRRSFEKIVTQLSKNAEVVASATRVLADRPQLPPDAGIDSKALSELQSALEKLTTIVEGLPSIVQDTMTSQREPAPVEPRLLRSETTPDSDLRGELQRLLHDLE